MNTLNTSLRLRLVFVLFLSLSGLVALLLLPGVSLAQTGTKTPVTADEVNRVAQKLYCPVCENIPLDTCGTAACAQWRDEIRLQLEQGRTEQQVVTDFVNRYGDRVVGTPQDPTLRALSLVIPWVVSVLALGVAVYVFIRWRTMMLRAPAEAATVTDAAPIPTVQSEYRARLERDLANRR